MLNDGDGGVTNKLLRATERPVLKALARLFNATSHRGTTPEVLKSSGAVL